MARASAGLFGSASLCAYKKHDFAHEKAFSLADHWHGKTRVRVMKVRKAADGHVLRTAQLEESLGEAHAEVAALRPSQLCINGMSYSNRGSKWANSAVVVSVGRLPS